MSYNVSIADTAAPASYEEGTRLLDDLAAGQDERVAASGRPFEAPSERMAALHRALTARFPCIRDDDGGPWSDGPLINNFGREVATLGISPSRVAEVLPFLVATANAQGMWVLDPQDEKLYPPVGAVHSAGQVGPSGTWRRLAPAQIEKADEDELRRRRSLLRPILTATLISAGSLALWTLGYRGGGPRTGAVFLAPAGGRSIVGLRELIAFGLVFAVFFTLTYRRQRNLGYGLMSEPPTVICGACHAIESVGASTACRCGGRWEPIRHWKWHPDDRT
jgi:hypothetical protein